MYPVLSTVLSISIFSATVAGCFQKRAKKKPLPVHEQAESVLEPAEPVPEQAEPVSEQAESEQPMDQPPPQLNIPLRHFYKILACFNRGELCRLRNVNRRHYTVIENRFGSTPPYLGLFKLRLSKRDYQWRPSLYINFEYDEMPSTVREQLPISKFVRFNSSELQVYNPNETNFDLLSIRHVWENQKLTLNCATNFVWNEEWANMAAKAKHLEVLNGQDSLSYIRQFTSSNCVRLSLTDHADPLDTVEIPWDHISDFLLQPNAKQRKSIRIKANNPFNHHGAEIREFVENVKQKFLNSPNLVHFTFAWLSFATANPFTDDIGGPVLDGFIVQNQRTQQKLRFHSTVEQFRLAVEDL